MANFIIVGGEPSGFGSKIIKIKPSSVNTSNITEKKGKLVIKVNGEVQRTISLSQAVKTPTPTPTPGTVTLVTREIALEVREMTFNSLPAEFTEVVNSDTYSKPITKLQTMNKRFTCNSKNATGTAKVTYSVSGIQTDYFSDGSNVKTNINPIMTTKPEDEDADWKISYSYKPKPESNLDIDDTFIYINQTLNITSNVILSSLPVNSTLKFTFTLEDVKTSKADVSYGMKLTVPCSLIIIIYSDFFQPRPLNPDLRPLNPDLNPQSDDDPIYVTE